MTSGRTDLRPNVQARASQLTRFVAHCEARAGCSWRDQGDFHRFSVAEFPLFWQLFLEWSDLVHEGSDEPVCVGAEVERATYFPAVRLNYAENLLRSSFASDDDAVAVVACHESGPPERRTRRELREEVRRLAGHLSRLGVSAGDRVAAVARNDLDALVAGLATATIGATFSSASPDMGAAAILSRFKPLQPKVLIGELGARGAPQADAHVSEVALGLPSVEHLIALDEGELPTDLTADCRRLVDLLATPAELDEEGAWPRFPFNHPLFVLFSSGTTGPPKCIVHGAGGTLLEHLKEHRLHTDLKAGDTLFFHTSTAWMMWNWQLSALASGARLVLFDGPITDPGTLWDIVAEQGVTVFGTSPPYLRMCEEAGYSPRRSASLSALRAVLSTGAVLHDWQYDWVGREVGGIPLQSISGGTDIVGCFVLGSPDLPVERGKIQCRSLGLDVRAEMPPGAPPEPAIGELVCANPFPSRPVGFLDDPDGRRFHDAYFSQHEGVWTHGDLIEFDTAGQARIHGRSDGVMNIQGVRIGPAEIYRALHSVAEVREAMAVAARMPGDAGDNRLVLLVVLQSECELDGRLEVKIRREIARQTTAMHVPSLTVAVPELPLTYSGKRSELAGREAVDGIPPHNREALRNPDSTRAIREAVAAAERRLKGQRPADLGDQSTETRLRAIWEELLGITDLRAEDAFFEVGGTSLLAVRLVRLIETRIGADLPLSAMLDAPTLGALARLIDDPAKSFDPLVLLRAGDQDRPLFFVHSLRGDVLEMRRLALELHTSVPIYGLRARGLNPDLAPHETVEEMAASYIAAIRSLQPAGPYRIAGYSFGGLVAYEMARLLGDSGQEVEWLGLLDAEVSPEALPPRAYWDYRLGRPFHLVRHALGEPRAAIDRTLRRLAARVLRRKAVQQPPPSSEEAAFTPNLRRLAVACQQAADRYRPGPYAGPVTYYVPTIRRVGLYADPLPVWRRVAVGGLTLRVVPGSHLEMASPANVGTLARLIEAEL
jgi:acetoacetyl-CoA synthetase